MPKIFDNIENQFSVGLSDHMANASRVDFCVGYFNLRGWGLVCDSVNKLTGGMVLENGNNVQRYCRLLVGMTKTPREELLERYSETDGISHGFAMASRYRKKLTEDFAEQLTIGWPTEKDEDNLQKLLEQLKNGRLTVKLFLQYQLHAKLYNTHSGGIVTPIYSLLGSSNLTQAGLSKQGELNVDVLEQDAANKLDKWFNARWLNRWSVDITGDLIKTLENSWARPDLIKPFLIYLKIAYHMSQDARAGLTEYQLPAEFSSKMLDFQQAAVKIAAYRLRTQRGIMIGDVVGLGKTIIATAIAKLLEEDLGYNTLIVCPKNLTSMWNNYITKYNLNAHVESQSMLTRNLPNLRRYKLVIIDESHNFRNNQGSRYSALKAYIEENESRVVLLSATPYNKSYSDLANQLKLFLPEDYDLGVSPERYINILGGRANFSRTHADINIRTIKAFENSSYTDDWREIMKLFLLRRTRGFIKSNYAKSDTISGRNYLEFSSGEKSFFPERVPKRVEFFCNKDDSADQYAIQYDEKVVDAINSLKLPRYGLQRYYNDNSKATDSELAILGNLSRAGRSVIGFCRTNLFKRLESSGYSFMLSLSRHILRNYIFLRAINLESELPINNLPIDEDIYSDKDDGESLLSMDFSWKRNDYENIASDYYNLYKTDYHKRFKWIRGNLFNTEELISDLAHDTEKLLSVLNNVGIWKPEQDRKLWALQILLTQTHAKDKILVFTQFADTANYIFQQLKERSIDNVAVAVGGSENLEELICRFSPNSNYRHDMPFENQIRVLITTDVLSEGQNLQDGHIVVNFDLPWAIARLIQRAGRVDRLGQKSPKIFCYSFLPEDGIERVIGLRQKLRDRISENAEVVGSDEVFFDGDPINIFDLYSEKQGILDDDGDEAEVDLASFAYQIWKNAIEKHPDVKTKVENMSNVVFSAKVNTAFSGKNGAIVYLRTTENKDALIWLDISGNVITNSQYAILKAAECEYNTPALMKLPEHHVLIEKCVELVKKESIPIRGALGRKNSVKYRVFSRLEKYINENKTAIIIPEKLKFALDAIYNMPLKENAIDTVSKRLRDGISDEILADLVISLYESGQLSIIATETSENNTMSILCSMSLIGEIS
jgi:superfamily II DNA or RNA helicase